MRLSNGIIATVLGLPQSVVTDMFHLGVLKSRHPDDLPSTPGERQALVNRYHAAVAARKAVSNAAG